MQDIYLLLGSNLGDSKKYISDAIRLIKAEIGAVISASSLYQTAAWGKIDQPDFINQIINIQSDSDPKQLLNKIIVLEKILGRQRIEKWGSRTIDIDILFYGNMIINEPDLVIPHPQLHNRRFTLMPLMELAPDFVHPILNQTISTLFESLKDKLYVKKL